MRLRGGVRAQSLSEVRASRDFSVFGTKDPIWLRSMDHLSDRFVVKLAEVGRFDWVGSRATLVPSSL